jgi:hypothetical protein
MRARDSADAEPQVTEVIYERSRGHLSRHFGRIDHSAGYGFWYSDYSGTVESTSGTASANSYNEKSLKPHQSE